MPAERYYLDAPLTQGETVFLKDGEYHHLVHVMRAKEGEVMELVNGRSQLAQARIEQIAKKQCALEVLNVETKLKPSFEIILVQAIPRANRLDFILEKGVELGATQFWLLPTVKSERKGFQEHQLEKMKWQMIAAMKQCGRVDLPEIRLVNGGLGGEDELVLDLPYSAYYGDVDPEAMFFEKAWQKDCEEVKAKGGVIFFTGPESGFTEGEIEQLKRLGVKGVKLHENILRTDTASLMALSLISHGYWCR